MRVFFIAVEAFQLLRTHCKGTGALRTALFVFAVHAHAAAPPDGILVIHSNQRPTPAQVIIDDTLRAVVPQELKRPVNLFSEYLDAEWTSLPTYGLAQAVFLREKYA